MCGIIAAINIGHGELPNDVQARLERGLDSIRHRGPDARASHVDAIRRFALGHVRLSVIDVSAEGTQPFWSACGRYVIVFNGEIYNYIELREELQAQGAVFRTATDTEVLITALIIWGEEALKRLNGMWAFVFVDSISGDCIVSRDRWGAKQLFWARHESALVFCSEAKGLIAYMGNTPQPDRRAIGLFCKHGMSGQLESSWFEGIHRFPAAHLQRMKVGDSVSAFPPSRYWDYPDSRPIVSPSAARDEIEHLLTDAIRIRLRSDVPVGLSLSGGLDSSCIAWLVRERLGRSLSAFSAWYPPAEQSELPQAEWVASRFGHSITPVRESNRDEILADLSDAIYHLDGGHGCTIVPYLKLCRAASKDITVMLEGQGADELFAGYVTFALYDTADSLFEFNPRRIAADARMFALSRGWSTYFLELIRHSSHAAYYLHGRFAKGRGLFTDDLMDAVPPLGTPLKRGSSNLARALRDSHANTLTYLLQYSDALAMSVGLESRCPFLDFRLVELGFSIHTSLLLGRGFGKLPLREIANANLPDDIVWNRRKQGFTNRTERLIAEAILACGFPSRGKRIAEELGLLMPGVFDSTQESRYSDTMTYRAACVALWLERFF